MLTLVCVVLGDGRAFTVKIEANEKVGELKMKIVTENKYDYPAKDLRLYCVEGLVQLGMTQYDFNGVVVDDLSEMSLSDFDGSTTYMIEGFPLSEYPQLNDAFSGKIHVLVVPPKEKTGGWGAKKLFPIDPQVQSKLWKSIVNIIVKDSSGLVDSSTALVVDRTSTHVYVLTNLHLFRGEEYTDVLSSKFIQDIKQCLRIHRGKMTNWKRKNEFAGPSLRRSDLLKTSTEHRNFKIAIEQYFPDEAILKEVVECDFNSGICWDCSVPFDFAILEIPTPPNAQLDLVGCAITSSFCPPMRVHVLGFLDNLDQGGFDHKVAIIPAKFTDCKWNEMTLSALLAPGFSECAIVCSNIGIPIGYLSGGFDATSNNNQYQALGYTLQAMPRDLPRALPRKTKMKLKRKYSTLYVSH